MLLGFFEATIKVTALGKTYEFPLSLTHCKKRSVFLMTSFIFPTLLPKKVEVERENTCHLGQVLKNQRYTSFEGNGCELQKSF
jgi:hypothetical protein